MSRVKKAVLFILIVAAFMLISTNANASGSAKIGGVFVNSESATVTASFNTQWEQGKWQQTFESDFQYKKEDDAETLNEVFVNTKANYTFIKHYVFAVAQYDYDKFRADGDRKVLGIGYGYKLLRTKRFKASNEFSCLNLQSSYHKRSNS